MAYDSIKIDLMSTLNSDPVPHADRVCPKKRRCVKKWTAVPIWPKFHWCKFKAVISALSKPAK